MNNIVREYYDKQERRVKDWFTEHEITFYKEYNDGVEHLIYKKPGTNCYKVEFMICNGSTLFIRGDIGCAVFEWSGDICFKTFAKMDFGYFCGKCQAYGRNILDWDADIAGALLKEHIEEHFFSDIDEDDDEERDPILVEQMGDFIDRATGYMESKHEFVTFINDNSNDVVEVLGEDYWEFVYSIGDVTPYRMRGYYQALQNISNILLKTGE